MRMSLKQIHECTGATTVVEPLDARALATGVSWDSRDVAAGDVYLALPGERVDGHDFVADALNAHAVAVLVMQPLGADVRLLAREMGAAVFEVPDTAHALTDMARFWRTQLHGRVVAVTGSTGKTTTKNLVRDVAAARYSVVATQGNQNNELGVPKTILSADVDTDVVVVEMGMRGSGQIADLCSFVRPDWGVVVNVGESHIELLGSREAIARAKAELLCALPEGRGRAFVNGDDDFAAFMVDHAHLDVRCVETVVFDGSGESAGDPAKYSFMKPEVATRVWADDITLDAQGRPVFTAHAWGFLPTGDPAAADAQASLERSYVDGEDLSADEEGYLNAEFQEETARCTLALRGAHNVANACAALAVGRSLGIPLKECAAALAASLPEAGRMEVVAARGGFSVVNDAYNANPDSMKASLAAFCALAVPGRHVAVLGDMGELGDYEQACHEGVGRAAARQPLDRLVCVGERARWIAAAAEAEGMDPDRIVAVDALSEVIGDLDVFLEPGDAVLVKASHFMGLDRVVEGLKN
ncbi:UDP-N-acetylmuramoyl-tripeptide--D-alanyl-D-alanine ligase [Xiamenia xianingshaonis]|uniref:UDP-N-acetylmuramoyl-tripeptide--D-alanyl-D-alanine ligase n=1 Tax=Xiamenia xianingshaonis TaxID=2682776 RepID=A0A9E6MRL8_9ACTN|nr:UDP-N-acetylmuramoyl-tripeptide--D-alanyl-D-alanine ligase [Xiamenia xianingshaonis]NHM14838.1 UDP-N-acetylmuramoyl-tripeptide--D-alanyl-D-alanine ligase [Xiamenia xianingshaonis]QTU84755.1 UDP-N-acetylmuramoyl-tripeptide--D-alanyl-D-alanine ligase [Xiamenia xianingshaonis]